MTAYLLVAIWIVGGIVSYIIAKRRGIITGFMLDLTGAVLGPFAIPVACLMKPER